MIGWTVFIGVVLAALFIGPPLWFNEAKTGYLYTGAFIGSIIGLILSGLFADWSAKLMMKWNHGKYEPEFRLVLVIPQLIFGGIGLYGFGYTTVDIGRYGWLLPDVFFMFVIIAMVMGAVASALYVVDAHSWSPSLLPSALQFWLYQLTITGSIAIEAFTALLVFKNMFSFILTYFAYDWVVFGGPKYVFMVIASIQVAVCLLTIPMCKTSYPPLTFRPFPWAHIN